MLKNDIINGVFPAGSRMPTRKVLEERFSVTSNTMQSIMDRLRREGFVETDGRNGTIVSPFPPHLYHYGMVFYGHPNKRGQAWPRFWDFLDQQAREFTASGPRQISCYYEFQGHTDTPDYQRLITDLQSQRLAGLILMPLLRDSLDLVLAQAGSVPVVGIMSNRDRPIPIIHTETGFLARALDHLATRGRKRIAFVIGPILPNNSVMQGVDELLAQRGMTTEPYWKFEFHLDLPGPARHYTQMLMRAEPGQRPDGLVIMDDNLVESATIGVAAAGTRVPEELDIVSHCNYPWPTPSIVPSRRLGYDTRLILAAAFARLDELRAGMTPQPISEIPLQFEDQVAPIPHSARLQTV